MASQLPSDMQAITINENKAKVTRAPIPKLRPGYLLAKVEVIALNPTDWKHINGKRAAPNSLSGCDFAGTVVEVSSEGVTKSFQPGDRIAGMTHGANQSQPEDGCFAEYCVAKADLVIKIPSTLSFEKAATLPLGAGTVGQGLYDQALQLALPTAPSTDNETVLIYGGSSATGSLAIQYAKLSGYRVLTTCSPHNNDFVTSLGADGVYDYKDPECGKKINQDTNDSLKLAWDTISLKPTAAIVSDALSSDPAGAKYGTILPVKLPREDREQIQTTFTFAYTMFGEDFEKAGRRNPANPAHFEFARKFYDITEKLVAEGKLKAHPELVGEKGLVGALQGMLDMKEDKVSAKKLVYRIQDTPKDADTEVEL